MNSSLTRTQSDDIAGVISAESCHIVLDTNPPDYVQKISRYLESSVGHKNVPTEPESDSGDSLFITQKVVPEAVRSGRRRHYSQRSTPTSPRELEEREEDSESSSSHGESRTDPKRRRKKYTLPKYSFPFLTEQNFKLGGALLPAHNASLHNYVMGGFFKCVRELWQDYQIQDLESSLPTVDMDGECISPLSEGDDERPEDEDIKVVERTRFVASSKAKSQQTRCNQLNQKRRRKVTNARQEKSKGLKMKTIPMSSDTKSSDKGESSCRVLVQRTNKHAASDRNFLTQTEAPKTKRRFTRGNKKVLSQKGSEEELCDDSDATVCEPRTIQRKQSTQKGRDASTTITEPRTDVFHTDDQFLTGRAGDGSESQNLLHSLSDPISDTNNDSVCRETKVKKKKDNGRSVEEGKGQSRDEPEGLHAATSVNVEVEETCSLSRDNMAEAPAPQSSDELELNEKSGMENSSLDDNKLRQEERDNPDSKQKKKRRKKNKSAAENAAQEVDGNLESDARVEGSVFSVSCNEEDAGKRKKKRSSEDVEQVQSSAVAEPLHEDAEIQRKKKKKKRKKEGVVITEECEEEEVSNRTLDLPPVSTEQFEGSGNSLESAADPHETLESSYVKRKKRKKKKRQSSSNDATQDADEAVDLSFCMDDSVTLAKGSGMSSKKKKTVFEGADISYTPEENEKFENVDNTQKTKEGLKDLNAELVTKKKKKKKLNELFSQNISEDKAAHSGDSGSVRGKKKKRTSSFLVADAEENDAQTHGEQHSPSQSVCGAEKPSVSTGDLKELNDGVTKKKKKRKRKMSVMQDSVEKDREQDFEEPNKTCGSALPEASDSGVKRKKKCTGNESESAERRESSADAGLSPTDEAAVSKKTKCRNEPRHVVQEGPPAATEDVESVKSTLNTCRSVSHKKKGKHGHSHDSSTSDQATRETRHTVEHASASSETPRKQRLNDMRDMKKKKKNKSTDDVFLEGLTKSTALENKKEERKEQSTVPTGISNISETSFSKRYHIMKNKHKNVKRRLHNPSEEFLTDC